MATEVILDRFPLTQAGWDAAWAALAQCDVQSARRLRDVLEGLPPDEVRRAEAERQAVMFEVFLRAQAIRMFSALGAQVLIGIDFVYTIGDHDPAARTNTSQLLGRLAGAEAVVTDGSQAWSPGRAMFMPIGLTGLATKTMAHAAIIFSDGTTHATALDGNQAVRNAQLQVVQFNALASASASPVPSGRQ